jgi:transposase
MPGDRVKTNRRDATMLARLHRAGELTPVWVPDADHEAMRDLIRLRGVVRQIVTRARQPLQGFLLRHGRKHGRGTAWRMAYRRWLSTLAFEHPAQSLDWIFARLVILNLSQRLSSRARALPIVVRTHHRSASADPEPTYRAQGLGSPRRSLSRPSERRSSGRSPLLLF